MPQEYTASDRVISVRVGEDFVVVLATNATTGYQWEPRFDAARVQLPAGVGVSAASGERGACCGIDGVPPAASASASARLMSSASWSAAMSVARETTRLAALMFAATWSARSVA